MEECLEDLQEGDVCELHVLKHMRDDINKNNAISVEMKETTLKCYSMVEGTKGEQAIKEIEGSRIVTYEVNSNKANKNSLKDMLKNVYL